MFLYHPVYLLLIIPALFGWVAQWKVRSTYFYYLEMPNRIGIKGSELATMILTYYHLQIPIFKVKKPMLNYYDPGKKSIYFCERILGTASVTSISIVAHEIEHARQDRDECRYMVIRKRLAKFLAATGQFSPFVFMWGVLFGNTLFVYTGILFLLIMTVFAIVSLPVEINASREGLETLKKLKIASQEEIKLVSIVLKYAAFTYFAGVAQRIGTFFFIVMIAMTIKN